MTLQAITDTLPSPEDWIPNSVAEAILSEIAASVLHGRAAACWDALSIAGSSSLSLHSPIDEDSATTMLNDMAAAIEDPEIIVQAMSWGPAAVPLPAALKMLSRAASRLFEIMVGDLRERLGAAGFKINVEYRISAMAHARSLFATNLDIRDGMPGCEEAALQGMMSDLISVVSAEFDGNVDAAIRALSQALGDAIMKTPVQGVTTSRG